MYFRNRPLIHCNDGLTLSIQTSSGHYCTPRDNSGPWHEVEVGFPSEAIPELMPYAEDPNQPTETVYGYVPFSLVMTIIENHGGLSNGSILTPSNEACFALK